MKSSAFLPIIPLICVPLLMSCGTNPDVLAKGDIQPAQKRGLVSKIDRVQVSSPSAALLSAAASKPKDKHAMPIYKYSERNRVVRTTAYTCSEDDHLIYGSKNATGTNLQYSDKVRSAAADWSFYPVGTIFRIKGMKQLFVIDDYGSALTGTGTIDLYKPCRNNMNYWGRRNVEVTVVQWGSFKRSAKILEGRTAFAHCRSMLANIRRQQSASTAVVASN